jgi:hypothetical protein
MIVPSDEDYKQTKRIKVEGKTLPSPFKELSDCIASHYVVDVLNIFYDTVIPDDRPRLSVILEYESDADQFRGTDGNFDKSKQDFVRKTFEDILVQQNNKTFDVDGLIVIFTSFERVARVEANERVTDDDIERLKTSLNNADIWDIATCFDAAVFFFYTNNQLLWHKATGLADSCAHSYEQLVNGYDEFGYLKRRGIAVNFDSKENFDKNFNESWFYYWR